MMGIPLSLDYFIRGRPVAIIELLMQQTQMQEGTWMPPELWHPVVPGMVVSSLHQSVICKRERGDCILFISEVWLKT
jgi:hypothetical protein